MEYIIEKNIPLPKKSSKNAGRKFKYPHPFLEVGESFVAEKDIRSAISMYAITTGKKFSMRKLENGSYRIWRIK